MRPENGKNLTNNLVYVLKQQMQTLLTDEESELYLKDDSFLDLKFAKIFTIIC